VQCMPGAMRTQCSRVCPRIQPRKQRSDIETTRTVRTAASTLEALRIVESFAHLQTWTPLCCAVPTIWSSSSVPECQLPKRSICYVGRYMQQAPCNRGGSEGCGGVRPCHRRSGAHEPPYPVHLGCCRLSLQILRAQYGLI